MKKILLPTLMLVIAGVSSCSGQYSQENNHVSVSPLSKNVNIQADANNAAFDVNALAALVQKSTDPNTLEQRINDPSNSINNLDLDKDGQVDYLTVTETGQNLLQVNDASVDPAAVVARLTISPDNTNNTANLQIEGTPAYCGDDYYYYRPHISFGTMLFMAYLLRPHSYYVPMYGYRHYPHYYVSHRTVVRTVYRPSRSQYMRPAPRGSRYYGGNNYRGGNRGSFSTPSSSRRGFSERSAGRPVGSGGFGSNRSTPNGGFNSNRSSGFGGSSRSSSNSSWGGGHSSFGSNRSSPARSFGSSSSRSFGSSGRSSSSSHSSGRSFGRRR